MGEKGIMVELFLACMVLVGILGAVIGFGIYFVIHFLIPLVIVVFNSGLEVWKGDPFIALGVGGMCLILFGEIPLALFYNHGWDN